MKSHYVDSSREDFAYSPVRFDYFRASVQGTFWGIVDALGADLDAGEPSPVRGDHGYGMGLTLPTEQRGTVVVLRPGQHEQPSVRLSGWPTDVGVETLRREFSRAESRASRVDAALDFEGDPSPIIEGIQSYAVDHGMKRAAYFVGGDSTGVEIGAGSSESRLRCYDAALKHPGEFARPTTRLEHEFKPGTRDRKSWAWSASAESVLGTSRAASEVLATAGRLLPSAPARTRRTGDFEAWLVWLAQTQGQRLDELLALVDGDLGEAFAMLRQPEVMLARLAG